MVEFLKMVVLALGILLPLCESHSIKSSQIAERSVRKLSLLTRALHGRRSDTQQSSQNNEINPVSTDCIKLVNVWEKLHLAVRNSDFAYIFDQMEAEMMSMHGVDLYNDAVVSASLCLLSEIDSIAELAQFVHMDEDSFRDLYGEVITGVNQGRQAWTEIVDSPYISSTDRRVIRALIDFFNVLESIGLLSLT